jgi:outer membrane protein TolC
VRPRRALRGLAAAVILSALAGTARTEAPPADSLTIADCARMAQEQSPEVRIAVLRRSSARYDSLAAWRNRRPVVSLLGSVLLAPDGFYDPAVTNLGDYELKLGLTLPLLDGGAARRARDRAGSEAHRAEAESDRSGRAAALRAAGLAIQILNLGEKERSGARALAWLNDLTALLDSRLRGGTSGPSDLMRVALERDAAETELASMRTALAIAERELGQVLGLGPAAAPPVRAPAPAEDRPPAPADSLRLIAGYAHLPEVRLAADAEIQARLDRAEVEQRKAPSLELAADAGMAGTDLTTAVPPELKTDQPGADFADRLRRDLGASVALNFKRTLIDASLAPALDARSAALQAASLERTLETDLELRAALDLLDRWRDAARNLRAQQSMVERAEANLLRVKTLYVAGATGLLDLLDARQLLDEAHARLADARAENRMAQMEAKTRT